MNVVQSSLSFWVIALSEVGRKLSAPATSMVLSLGEGETRLLSFLIRLSYAGHLNDVNLEAACDWCIHIGTKSSLLT